MQPSKGAAKLVEMLKKAIEDHEVTNAEYEEILQQAHADHHVDRQEKELLRQLHEMIENGTVKRVP